VQKYLRMKHVIVFKMSHDVLQVSYFPSHYVLDNRIPFVWHSSTSMITQKSSSPLMVY
jgi:hypothetical protein